MPIILKGISTAEDAILAYEAGVQGIVLSNHGGRQLDTSRSGLEVLVEVTAALRAKGYFPDPKFEIFVDGGVRRASDVLKAIALGAKAVGVGRAFLYSFCAYGQDGVERAIQIFRDEFEMNMRLLGARTIDELKPEMVDARALNQHIVTVPQDNLFQQTCEFVLTSRTRPECFSRIALSCRSTVDGHTARDEQALSALHRLCFVDDHAIEFAHCHVHYDFVTIYLYSYVILLSPHPLQQYNVNFVRQLVRCFSAPCSMSTSVMHRALPYTNFGA